MARILVTGAGGQLGNELASLQCADGRAIVALTRAQLDITDPASVAAAFQDHQPDVVINCAAWTDVDGAETHPEAAFAVNATGPRVVARECSRCDARLIHMSTDYVFDGCSPEPIDEDEQPSPASVYGKSKLAGEWEVQNAAPRHCIVRTSGLYGRDGPNFVLTILRRAAADEELRIVADQVTAPTSTADLAGALLRLVALNAEGTFHLTNGGRTTWHGFVMEALAVRGLTRSVQAVTTADLHRPAARPQSTVLDNRHWRVLGEPPLPHWRHALARYLQERLTTARV
jgi:dTDP-4-dehydrorhamnose reductase